MPKINLEKMSWISGIISAALAAWALLAPSAPSANVTGNSNTTIQGSNNVVTNNTVVMYSNQKPDEIGPLKIQDETLPNSRKSHDVKFFSVISPLPSEKLAKINAFIKSRTLEIYNNHKKFEEVAISVTPEFIGYGLLGVNIDIELATHNGEIQIDRDVEPETATFLAYMSSAHPLQKADGFVLSIETGEPFEFKDLFRSNYKTNINSLVIEKLKASNSYFECTSDEDFEKKFGFKDPLNKKQIEKYLGYSFANCFSTVQDNSRFSLSPIGIVLRFSRYEIGPGSLGAVELPIPFIAVKNLVNPNGPLAFLSK